MRFRLFPRRLASARGLFVAVFALSLAACGDDDEDKCEKLADCEDGEVCLIRSEDASCAALCTEDAKVCGDEEECLEIGVLAAKVCMEPVEFSTDKPPVATDHPRVPCEKDDECGDIVTGSVCAEWDGKRDCAQTCAQEAECDLPKIDDIEVDFLTCIADEADDTRTACVPDAACLGDDAACVTLP